MQTAHWCWEAGRGEKTGELAPWKEINLNGSRMCSFLCTLSASVVGIDSPRNRRICWVLGGFFFSPCGNPVPAK